MSSTLYIDNHEDLDSKLNSNDIEVCKIIVDSIIKYLRTPRKVIHICEVVVGRDKSVYDITLFRNEAHEILSRYLPILEIYEEYERCHLITLILNNKFTVKNYINSVPSRPLCSFDRRLL